MTHQRRELPATYKHKQMHLAESHLLLSFLDHLLGMGR
jgi:hypothetical protein